MFCSLRGTLHFLVCTLFTKVFVPFDRMTVISKRYNNTTSCTFGRQVGGRIFQFLKVEFIRSIKNIYLRFKGVSAFRTVLPVARVLFGMMVSTESITAVIPVAAIPCIGKRNVFVFIITNPLIAAFCFRQFLCFPAQPAPWLASIFVLFSCSGFGFSGHILSFCVIL